MMALLAFANFTAGLEIHTHREVLSSDLAHAAMEGQAVSPEAVHPGAARHWEAGSVETPFRCPVCLLHLQTSGTAALETASPVVQAPERRLAASEPSFHHAASHLPGGSRAPPVSR